MKWSLLEQLCAIRGVSGDEDQIASFLLQYINEHASAWASQPKVISGDELQGAIVLVFGKPRTAVFAHMDTIGYTAAYGSNLIKVGGPAATSGATLVGQDEQGEIACELHIDDDGSLHYTNDREIQRGTCLSYAPNFRLDEDYVQSPYLDNRLGVFVALQVAETMENGIICFSCYEEHGGGSAQVLAKYIYEQYQVQQTLISDITWITTGVQHGNGVAISMRDSGIPKRSYLNKILSIAQESNVPFQMEVEGAGGSDGNAIQHSPYPIHWCFIGAAEDNVHTPDEKVAVIDVVSMIELYKILVSEL